jgi:dihydrofolate reductase
MGKVRVAAFTVSLDGYGAGPGQTLEKPMGEGTDNLHAWMFGTSVFRAMIGADAATPGPEVDERFAKAGFDNIGAWIMGRNMFGPVRGEWPDDSWRGWWGETPPYHCHVYVLTHHAREPLAMDGGTVFHFVTGGAEEALGRAKVSAGGKDIRIGGGASTVRQYLERSLIDELHLAVSPILLGAGEPLLTGLDLPKLGYTVREMAPSSAAAHVVIGRE